MKNYFFGINRNAHVSIAFREKNLFINDNKIRFSDLAIKPRELNNMGQGFSVGRAAEGQSQGAGGTKFAPNGQSITSEMTVGMRGSDSLESKLDTLREITGNDPFAKLSPQAFNALASGKDVQLQIQQTAPERRNLFIGAFVTALQLMGGAGGAAYSDELGAYMKDRAAKDADFVTRHGNDYKMNLFGGAEARETYITATVLDSSPATNPVIEREMAKRNDDKIVTDANKAAILEAQRAAAKEGTAESTPMSVGETAGFNSKFGFNEQNQVGKTQGGNGTGTQQAGIMLSQTYGPNAVDLGNKDRKTVASIYVYGKDSKGNVIDYLNGDDLKGNGKSTNAATLEARRQAVKDYLALGASIGLVSQDQIKAAGNDSKKLIALFQNVESQLKTKYKDFSGTVKDGFLGDHHITAMQKAISDRIQYNQGGAFAINAIVNAAANPNNPKFAKDVANLTPEQKKAALEFFQKADPQAFSKMFGADIAKSMQSMMLGKSGSVPNVDNMFNTLKNSVTSNYSGLSGAVGKIDEANKAIKNTIVNTAKGMYVKNNDILAQNLNSVGSTSVDKKMSELVSSNKKSSTLGTTGGTSFSQQIGDLQGFISRLQTGTAKSSTSTSQMSFEGKSGDIATVANAMSDRVNSFGGKKLIDEASINPFISSLKEQLTASGITSVNGKAVTELNDSDIKELLKDPKSVKLEGGTKETQEQFQGALAAVANLSSTISNANTQAKSDMLATSIESTKSQVQAINAKNNPSSKEVFTVSQESGDAALKALTDQLKDSLKSKGITSVSFGGKDYSVDSLTKDSILEMAQAKAKDGNLTSKGTDGKPIANLDSLVSLATAINDNQALFAKKQQDLDAEYSRKSLDISRVSGGISNSSQSIGQAKVESARVTAGVQDVINSQNSQPNQGANSAGEQPTNKAAGAGTTPSASSQLTEFLSQTPGIAALKDSEIKSDKNNLKAYVKEGLKGLSNLSDLVTMKLLEIADMLLKKASEGAAADGNFDYGFSGASHGRITSQDNLQNLYKNAKDVGGTKNEEGQLVGGIAGGMSKINEYKEKRQEEALNPTYKLDKVLDAAKEQTKNSLAGDLDKLKNMSSGSNGSFKAKDFSDLSLDIKNKLDFLERNGGLSSKQVEMKAELESLNKYATSEIVNSSNTINERINQGLTKLDNGGAKDKDDVKGIRVELDNLEKSKGSISPQEYLKKLKEIEDKVIALENKYIPKPSIQPQPSKDEATPTVNKA